MKNNIIWLFAGFIGVAAAVSSSFLFESHWVGYFASMTVAVILLILMASSMTKTISSSGMKKTMIYIFASMVILQGYYSVFTWNKAQFQKDTLREIRLTIDSNIGQIQSEKLLVQALKSFYLNDSDSTLEAHFLEVAGDRLQQDGAILLSERPDQDELKLYYEILASDSIVIHVNSTVAFGDDPGFQNRDGEIGRYEAMAILTERGVRYVRQN